MEALYTFDFSLLNWIQNTFKSDFMDFIMPKITVLGDAGIFWIIVAVVFLFFKKTRKTGLMMGCALILGLIFGNGLLKNLFARERPYSELVSFSELQLDVKLLVGELSDYSFPSGHTLASFECATVLMIRDKRFGIPALILATLIAFSRLYLYVHFPTDVFAGIVLGVIFGILGVIIVKHAWDAVANKIAAKKAQGEK